MLVCACVPSPNSKKGINAIFLNECRIPKFRSFLFFSPLCFVVFFRCVLLLFLSDRFLRHLHQHIHIHIHIHIAIRNFWSFLFAPVTMFTLVQQHSPQLSKPSTFFVLTLFDAYVVVGKVYVLYWLLACDDHVWHYT